MWQYLVAFIFSTAMVYIAERFNKRNRKHLFYICVSLAIFSLAFLAAVRSDAIGADYRLYQYHYNISRNQSLAYLFNSFFPGIEPLFLILNWVAVRIMPYEMFMFLEYAFILLLYISTFYKNKKTSSLWLAFGVYCLSFYTFSLNGIRQAIAMSILYYGFQYLDKKNTKKFIAFTLIAMGFHYTAIIGLFLWIIYELAKSKNKYIRVLSVVLAPLSTLGVQVAINVLVRFVSKYSRYASSELISIELGPILLRLPLILMLIFLVKYYKGKSDKYIFWIAMLLGELAYTQLRSVATPLYRASFYMGLFKLQAYPFIEKAFTKKNRYIVNIMLLILLLVIWYYQIVLQGNDTVYPYASDIIRLLN